MKFKCKVFCFSIVSGLLAERYACLVVKKISIGFWTSTLKSWSRSLKWMASFVASTKEFISASAVDVATHLWTFVDQLTTAEVLLSLKPYPEVLFLWSKFPAQSASEKHSKVNLSPLLKTKLFDLETLRYLKTLFPAFQCFSPGFSTNELKKFAAKAMSGLLEQAK